jgi:CheY-like chemotaxis protein
MGRILLVHWNQAEAEERGERLRRAGHQVSLLWDSATADYRAVRADPPQAFLIDLNRLPSHGRALGIWLRQQKATRSIPLVFLVGDPQKTEDTRKLLPDAVFTEWKRVRSALTRALRHPPRQPVVPGTMAGYSGTPLPKKLGIKAGRVVALLGAPPGFEKILGELPEKVKFKKQARGSADLILLFVKSQANLNRRFPAATRMLVDRGRIWIIWPKRASGVASDLTQNVVRAFGLDRGLVDFKISAIDPTWSGLCFTRRQPKAQGRNSF